MGGKPKGINSQVILPLNRYGCVPYTGMRLKEIIARSGLNGPEHVDFRQNCLRLSYRETNTK
jgi:hypothetical protein